MNETTLKRIKVNSLFEFGGVTFIKLQESGDDELTMCGIPNTDKKLYILEYALVIPVQLD